MMLGRVTVTLFAVTLIAGCGDDKKFPSPKSATNPASSTANTGNEAKTDDNAASKLPQDEPKNDGASAVHISDEIRKACGITEKDAYFAFDSSKLRPGDAVALDKVAVCFTSGPLKGKTVNLVGHADPRGGADYNMTLGQKRADEVKTYLVGKGMTNDNAKSTTRGAMDATGSDEPGWAKDRRVDVMLAQ